MLNKRYFLIYSLLMTAVVVASNFLVQHPVNGVLAGINLAAVKQVARARVDASRRLAQESGKLVGTAMGGLRMIEVRIQGWPRALATLAAGGREDGMMKRPKGLGRGLDSLLGEEGPATPAPPVS